MHGKIVFAAYLVKWTTWNNLLAQVIQQRRHRVGVTFNQ